MDDPFLAPWLQGLLEKESSHWAANVNAQMARIDCAGYSFPLTINETEWDNSYVCSPYTAFVSYAKEELVKLQSPILERALEQFIALLSRLLRLGQINRVVHINNWLLSTNLYPDWQGEDAELLHERLRGTYPDHVLIFRSLNYLTNPKLLGKLEQLGYRLLPSRQVYFFQGPNLKQHKNYLRDLRLLRRTTDYQIVGHEELKETDFPRLAELYAQLYLDKYSRHNPAFTESLLKLWHRHKCLTMTGLRHPNGRLDGIVGMWERNGVTTVPLVGYEMSVPQSVGLYRMLMAVAIEDVHRRKNTLNLSAGASHFKRLRGGRPVLEYSAVYYRHLGGSRRLVWGLLDMVLSYLAAPLMRYFKV